MHDATGCCSTGDRDRICMLMAINPSADRSWWKILRLQKDHLYYISLFWIAAALTLELCVYVCVRMIVLWSTRNPQFKAAPRSAFPPLLPISSRVLFPAIQPPHPFNQPHTQNHKRSRAIAKTFQIIITFNFNGGSSLSQDYTLALLFCANKIFVSVWRCWWWLPDDDSGYPF